MAAYGWGLSALISGAVTSGDGIIGSAVMVYRGTDGIAIE